MKVKRGRILRWVAGCLALLLAIAVLAGVWFFHQLKRSLPQLDGTAAVAGLAGPVKITRDALGVPTLQGKNRLDVARALGWLHTQDRFFQMDLLRRSAAGELAELFGKAAVGADKSVRVHGFRALAQQDLTRLQPPEKALVEAYTAGVNAGLQALAEKPFEYAVLRTDPQPWKPEDTLLVAFSMALQLHDNGRYERSITTLRNVYGMDAVNFFAPLLTPDDAALDGSTAPLPPIPSPQVIDLRRDDSTAQTAARLTVDDPAVVGSNSFAVSGAHTDSGVPMLANDMHLVLQVPNAWYRASLVWPAEPRQPDHRVTGVTLPGLPLVIAGSNGHVAWGFTNAYADASDIVIVQPNAISHALYVYGNDLVEFNVRHEVIKVKGGDPVNFDVTTTRWGPVIAGADSKHPLVLHWTMQMPGAINLSLIGLETARTVTDAVHIAHHAGMPTQNLLAVDDRGNMAWTIAGALPQRVGYDGRFATPWTYLDRYWTGMVPPTDIPTVMNPTDGRLWTANNRVMGDPALKVLGDGGYDSPIRARGIRDDLEKLTKASPADLLAIQLDTRTPLLDRWQKLMLKVLTPEAIAGHGDRAAMRTAIEKWEGHAAVDSVSYRLVRGFRQQVASLVFTPIMAPCRAQDADFNWHAFHYEQPLWVLLNQQPANLLNPHYPSWDDLLLAAVDEVAASLKEQGLAPARATWGQRNRARIRHPFGRVLPRWLTSWLNMPADPLPGDSLAPRVQGPAFGASERFVVSPGREAEGIFEMPGGQSGHPLSPYYRAGHEDWVHGRPTPFLPGPTQHTLTLEP